MSCNSCNAYPSPNALSVTQSKEKSYSAEGTGAADAAGFEVDAVSAVLLCSALSRLAAGARLEWMAGEWVTWLVGFDSASWRSGSNVSSSPFNTFYDFFHDNVPSSLILSFSI